MERNYILAFVLCFLVLIGTQYWIALTSPPPKPKPPAEATDQDPGASPTSTSETAGTPTSTAPRPGMGAAEAGPDAPEREAATDPASPGATAASEPPAAAQQFTLENDVLRVVLDSKGARLSSAVLKNFFDYRPRRRALADEPPLDLLDAFDSPSYALGFALVDEPGFTDATWHAEALAPDRVRLWRRAGIYRVEQEIAIGAGYHLDVSVRVQNLGEKRKRVRYDLGVATGIKAEEPNGRELQFAVAGLRGEKEVTLETIDATGLPKLSENPQEVGGIGFGGIASKYFAIVLMPAPDVSYPALMLRQREGVLVGARDGERGPSASATLRPAEVALDPGKDLTHTFRLYVGPKDDETVAPYKDAGLDKLVDLSSFVPLAESLSLLFIAFLHKLSSLLGSYGAAIVILTLVVRGLLHPLSAKSQRSTYRMQKLAPKVKEIQKRFEGKKSREQMQKMQLEMAELYKKNGVSPIAGCLPMVLQLPVFIGLYNALAYSIELRQMGFLWISDLSKPDRTMDLGMSLPWPVEGYLNVLPLCMAVTMYMQQAMAPKPADPQQEQQMKMMRMITIIFPALFYTIPSGLVLYFFISSLVGMMEARWIRKQLEDEDVAKAAAAAAL